MMTVRFSYQAHCALCGKSKRMYKLRIRFYEISNEQEKTKKNKMKREKRTNMNIFKCNARRQSPFQ